VVQSPTGARDFSLFQDVRRGARINQLPIYWEAGTIPGLKLHKPEEDHSPSSTGKLKN